MSKLFAVQIVEKDGEVHVVRHESTGCVVVYRSRARADAAAEFWREGLGDEVQGVAVVTYDARRHNR